MMPEPVSLAGAERAVEMTRIAIAELGYSPDLVRVPSSDLRQQGVAVWLKSVEPTFRATVHRAGLLRAITLHGPESPRICLACTTKGYDRWSECPRYPVGALLAGAVKGCDR